MKPQKNAQPAPLTARPSKSRLAKCTLFALITVAFSTYALASSHASKHPGYLGVSIIEVNGDQARQAHLKDGHGVMIVSVDRDGPAASAGLHPQDILLSINNKKVEKPDDFRKLLHDTTAGTNITMRISREGNEQTISITLGDEEQIAQHAWDEHFAAQEPIDPDPDSSSAATTAGHPANTSGILNFNLFSLSTFYTGLDVDPLTPQLAEYFGVHDGAGLLVRTVDNNSPGSSAGLHAGDVILRINGSPATTHMDWIKQLHANRGHSMQMTIIRNHKEQTATLTATSGKKE